jgi:hypothetical protein
MHHWGVSLEELEKKQVIAASENPVLSWDYLQYVRTPR